MELSLTIGAADSAGPLGVYQWGLQVIRVIQRMQNPFLTAAMRLITALGTEAFYIPVILYILWCIDEKKGMRLGILLLLSDWGNGFFKALLRQPRPYQLDPSVGMAYEPTFGLPSGHAQHSFVFWIALLSAKSPIALSAILLIGFTRLYLGVHFPTDLLGGWLLGALILLGEQLIAPLLAAFLHPPASRESQGIAQGPRLQLIAAAGIALGMNASGADSNLSGLFLGLLGGNALWSHTQWGAQPLRITNTALNRAIRFGLGLCVAGIIYAGLRLILPGEGSLFAHIDSWGAASPYYRLGRFIRYLLLGVWASLGAPLAFLRMGLGCGAPGSSHTAREE